MVSMTMKAAIIHPGSIDFSFQWRGMAINSLTGELTKSTSKLR
jgi:hypothetical protein